MSSVVNTYLKVDQKFIPISEYVGALPDKNYIEGAIICQIDNQDIFTMEHWDLVDQLWVYIVEGLTKLKQGLEYDSSFPDQPLRLRFRPISTHAIEVTVGNKCQIFNLDSLIVPLVEGAFHFFSSMKMILPELSNTWDRYLETLTELAPATG